jgi:hypothetical protein
MNEQSWEARAVDEIIALEKRQVELIRLIGDKEGLWLLASELHLNTSRLEQQIEELSSELEDVLNELEG